MSYLGRDHSYDYTVRVKRKSMAVEMGLTSVLLGIQKAWRFSMISGCKIRAPAMI